MPSDILLLTSADGQIAYDVVMKSMKASVNFDLIFMDVQVCTKLLISHIHTY